MHPSTESPPRRLCQYDLLEEVSGTPRPSFLGSQLQRVSVEMGGAPALSSTCFMDGGSNFDGMDDYVSLEAVSLEAVADENVPSTLLKSSNWSNPTGPLLLPFELSSSLLPEPVESHSELDWKLPTQLESQQSALKNFPVFTENVETNSTAPTTPFPNPHHQAPPSSTLMHPTPRSYIRPILKSYVTSSQAFLPIPAEALAASLLASIHSPSTPDTSSWSTPPSPTDSTISYTTFSESSAVATPRGSDVTKSLTFDHRLEQVCVFSTDDSPVQISKSPVYQVESRFELDDVADQDFQQDRPFLPLSLSSP
ncbi:hypothetical protein HDU67_001819, partial [Dinochytrium kinnereticum]